EALVVRRRAVHLREEADDAHEEPVLVERREVAKAHAAAFGLVAIARVAASIEKRAVCLSVCRATEEDRRRTEGRAGQARAGEEGMLLEKPAHAPLEVMRLLADEREAIHLRLDLLAQRLLAPASLFLLEEADRPPAVARDRSGAFREPHDARTDVPMLLDIRREARTVEEHLVGERQPVRARDATLPRHAVDRGGADDVARAPSAAAAVAPERAGWLVRRLAQRRADPPVDVEEQLKVALDSKRRARHAAIGDLMPRAARDVARQRDVDLLELGDESLVETLKRRIGLDRDRHREDRRPRARDMR